MADAVNKLGHRIGARGGRTRSAILEALRGLLATRHLGEIRIADVAQSAAISAPTFYTYFDTLDEALLALCDEVASDWQGLAHHVEADWSAGQGLTHARALITDMLALWDRHGAIIRVEQMMADRGDPAFAEARIGRLRRLHLALERRIAQAANAGLHPQGYDPRLASYEVANIAESAAASFKLLKRADSDQAIIETTALILVRLITGR
ncbi:TetR/AcrR family transcriptional regulator [Brevundimonas sp.]|uniref:TetR/AcrR family transcriptional regulator n=1 Tax=Brevundimonas sp. TaxID=1871086 RepID=UPI003AF94D8C